MSPSSAGLTSFRVAILGLFLYLSGCSWDPVLDAPSESVQTPRTATNPLVRVAEGQLGVPYRYGGSSPSQGFDCSGLVFYTHRQLGISVPRTSEQQYRASSPVGAGDLRPGDLLFYRTDGKRVSHVGIYIGGRRFVHAPNSGGTVRYASLDDEFWTNRFVGAGRFVN